VNTPIVLGVGKQHSVSISSTASMSSNKVQSLSVSTPTTKKPQIRKNALISD
jgi:hypothetical protein